MQLVLVLVKGGDQQLRFVQGFYFIVNVQFAINVLGMFSHGLHTYFEAGSNFFGRLALRHDVQDFCFAAGNGLLSDGYVIKCKGVHAAN